MTTLNFAAKGTRFWHPSTETWENEPYMVKEHTVFSECGKYAATVVVIPAKKKRKNGAEVDGLDFIPMGVRIEWVAGRTSKEGYCLPGSAYFVKKKTAVISETRNWSFVTDRCSKLVISAHKPILNKPQRERADQSIPFTEHAHYSMLSKLEKMAWASYEAYRAAKRAA